MQKVYGPTIDNETRCIHYHTEQDIIAIKFHCCRKYYPCYKCHEECEEHPISLWKQEDFDEPAILCGVCGKEHTINQYMYSDRCRNCKSIFNEGCKNHYHLYFEYRKN